MKNKVLYSVIVFVSINILFSCQKKDIVEYEGYALLSYFRFEERKQIELILLRDYDIKDPLDDYMLKRDSLDRVLTFVSFQDFSYYKILDRDQFKGFKNDLDISFDLVRIKFKIGRLDHNWIEKDVGMIKFMDMQKETRDLIITKWNDNNKLIISSLEYIPLNLDGKL